VLDCTTTFPWPRRGATRASTSRTAAGSATTIWITSEAVATSSGVSRQAGASGFRVRFQEPANTPAAA